MNSLRILMVASEIVPFSKTGGLADVVGALPRALEALGHDVTLVTPRYYVVDKKKWELEDLSGSLSVPMGALGAYDCSILRGTLPKSKVSSYFVEHDAFYGSRTGLYGTEEEPFSDNDHRFLFLSRAALELCKKIFFKPDVIHVHDWHAACIPALIKTKFADDPFFAGCPTVLTIHNLRHQGICDRDFMSKFEIGWEHFQPEGVEFFGHVNVLKAGIVFSDAVTTVSPTYSKEIQTAEFGEGLEGVLRNRVSDLTGILNGADYEIWNPATDTAITANFSRLSMDGKETCKKSLQEEFQLAVDPTVPLFGFVGRIDEQKGVHLIADAIADLSDLGVQVILLGTGDKTLQDRLRDLSADKSDSFACRLAFDSGLAQRIYAGSDFFLMPSFFEPCGLGQMYSMRYGSIPIVRSTGGLHDTVTDFVTETKKGTGFTFRGKEGRDLLEAVKRALEVYRDQDLMKVLVGNAMSKKFTWESSAQGYLDVYRSLTGDSDG